MEVVAAASSGLLNTAFNKLGPEIIQQLGMIWGVSDSLDAFKTKMSTIREGLEAAEERAIQDKQLSIWLKKVQNVAYDADDLLDELQMKAEMHNNHFKYNLFSRRKVAKKIKEFNTKFDELVEERSKYHFVKQLGNGTKPKNDDRVTMSTCSDVEIIGREQDKKTIVSEVLKSDGERKVSIISIIGMGGLGKTTLAQLVYDEAIVHKHFNLRMWIYVSEEFDTRRLMKALFESVAGTKPDIDELDPLGEKIKGELKEKKFLLVLDDVWPHSLDEWEKFSSLLNVCGNGSKIIVTTREDDVAIKMRSIFRHKLKSLSNDDSWTLFKQRAFRSASEESDLELVKIGKEILHKCGGVPLAMKALGSILYSKERKNSWMAVRDSDIWRHTTEGNKVMMSLKLSYFHLPPHLKQCFTICSLFPKGHRIEKVKLIDLWIAHDMITSIHGPQHLENVGNESFNSLVQMSFLQDVRERDYLVSNVNCRMHDLVHDLARSILSNEIYIAAPDKAASSTKSIRYFSLTKDTRNVAPSKNSLEKARAIYVAGGDFIFGNALKKAKHLRSITMDDFSMESIPVPMLELKSLRYLSISRLTCKILPEAISDIWNLQTLHLKGSNLYELPKSIGKQQKLRTLDLLGSYSLKSLPESIGDCCMLSSLDLSNCVGLTVLPESISGNKNLRILRLPYTNIERLPSSITTLSYLECLDLRYCSKLVELPEGIANLKKLEVLNLARCNTLCGMPAGVGQLTRLQKLGLFVVGEDKKSARISELGNLERIKGELTITNIVNVKDPNDALKASLKQKNGIQRLILEWKKNWRNNDELSAGNGLDVLDCLEPSSGIEYLHIYGFPCERFPEWMMNQNHTAGYSLEETMIKQIDVPPPRFPCLTSLTLASFPNLKKIAELVEPPSLNSLYLGGMPALGSICVGPFPALVELYIREMPSLEALNDGEISFPCLSTLSIQHCPKLKVKPCLSPSLETLFLSKCDEKLLVPPSSSSPACSSVVAFPSLKKFSVTSPSSAFGWESMRHHISLQFLHIEDCDELIQLPESIRNLTALQELHIERCSALCLLPKWLGELHSLQSLYIITCNSLISLPQSMEHLTALRRLDIEECDALAQLPEGLGELRSLEKMGIHGCNKLISLPQSMEHLTSLRRLTIYSCVALAQLPNGLGELCSLKSLEIMKLQGLTCLPQSMHRLTSLECLNIWSCQGLKSLPKWIKDLTALQYLEIGDCPDLQKRCKRGKGKDWHLISHIPHVQV